MTKSDYKGSATNLTHSDLEIGQLAEIVLGPYNNYKGVIVVKIHGGKTVCLGSTKESIPFHSPFKIWPSPMDLYSFRLLGPEESVTLSND